MFQRHALIGFVLLVAGCATASEPPVQQAVAPKPTWETRSEQTGSVQSSSMEAPARVTVPAQHVAPVPPTTASPSKVEPKATSGTDDAIIQYVLSASRARYPGNCACPDDRDRAGKRCGGRSAYSRPGGYAPLCYPHDVTPEMIEKARREMRL